MRRSVVGGWITLIHSNWTRRSVHDRPFDNAAKDDEVKEKEARQIAEDALLQFNLMIHKGVQPDALVYTSLIATMGRAKLEWQAYKLFSRMLEQNIAPLPETYVALRDATSPKRTKLIADIELKMKDAIQQLPSSLANQESQLARVREEQSAQRFDAQLSGDLSVFDALPGGEAEAAELSETKSGESGNAATASSSSSTASYGTVLIRNPTDVWQTHKHLEEMKQTDIPPTGDHRAALRQQLEKLHDEELRIFLATKRQLRHGDRTALLDRVVDTVGATSIELMLQRRKRYFTAVADVLKGEIDARNALSPSSSLEQEVGAAQAPGASSSSLPASQVAEGGVDAVEAPMVSSPSSASDVLLAPWGALRKPRRSGPPVAQPTHRQPRRDGAATAPSLTQDEEALVESRVAVGDIDELPQDLLRRYASHHNLPWKRKHAQSLTSVVQWFVTKGKSGIPTESLRRQQSSDMKRSLENFEVFRLIAQQTKNLQVVDSKEVNLLLKEQGLQRNKQERRAEQQTRQDRYLADAEALRVAARQYRGAPVERGESHAAPSVLGLTRSAASATMQLPESQQQKEDEVVGDELPPWALHNEMTGDHLNFKTGRFGDPTKGRYQELSDGRFQVLPNRESETVHRTNLELLSPDLKDQVMQAKLNEEMHEAERTREREEKMKYHKFQKFSSFIARAKDKSKKQKQQKDEEVRPIAQRRKMSFHLQRGRDTASVSDELRAKFKKQL